MNPDYLWVTEGLQLIAMLGVMPLLALAIGYVAWRGKSPFFKSGRYRIIGLASLIASLLLFGLAHWIDADVRSAEYFVELGVFVLSVVLFGVAIGCGFGEFLRMWRWHRRTKLQGYSQ